MQGKTGAMLISLHHHFPVRIMDWLLSAIMFSWGVVLWFLSADMWAMPVYDGLARWGTQTEWATIGIGIGLTRIAALLINGALRRSPHLRGVGAFLSIFIWVELSISLMFTTSPGVAVAIVPWLALADMFNVYRAAQDARLSDTTAKAQRKLAAGNVPERS